MGGGQRWAWEIRIAAAEILDLFQQVALWRFAGGDAIAFKDPSGFAEITQALGEERAATLPEPPRPQAGTDRVRRDRCLNRLSRSRRASPPASSTLAEPPPKLKPLVLLPPAVMQDLADAAHDLEERAPREGVVLDASAARDKKLHCDAADRHLAEQSRDVQTALVALSQRLSLENLRPGLFPGKDAPPAVKSASPAGSDPVQRYRDMADKLRARTDTFGKLLGSVGTTLITAAGISRISGLFPVPPHDTVLIVGTFLSLVVGIGAVLWIALRLNNVANPISLRSDINDLIANQEITGDESSLLNNVYRRTYELNNAKACSLTSCEDCGCNGSAAGSATRQPARSAAIEPRRFKAT